MNMPRRISAVSISNGNKTSGFWDLEISEGTTYTRTDLAQSLADALEGMMRDLPSNKDWLDPVLEAMAQDALEAYRKAKGE